MNKGYIDSKNTHMWDGFGYRTKNC